MTVVQDKPKSQKLADINENQCVLDVR